MIRPVSFCVIGLVCVVAHVLIGSSTVAHHCFSSCSAQEQDETKPSDNKPQQGTKNPDGSFPDTKGSIAAGLTFLMRQQADDGAWHSQHYGSMRQGAAVTAFALYSISHLPDEARAPHVEGFKKAVDFLKLGIEKRGCVSAPDGSMDYPVYSTALILTVHKKLDIGLTATQVKRMVQFLLDSQCNESRGFTPDNANLGGWDILGPGSTEGKTAGANVSVTFYVLEALSLYQADKIFKDDRVKTSIAAARTWCDLIVKTSSTDGFYFTSEIRSNLNKAGWAKDEQPRVYGTATCDGLGILLHTGSEKDSEAVKQTLAWLVKNRQVDQVPGFTDEESNWPSSLRFYYLTALSRSLNLFEPDFAIKQRKSIAQLLVDSQAKTGFWKSDFNQMRENDPLIATSFALIALANVGLR
ncbi:MAG: prenyltransferase/squalene oxidase repeat-containing protein [Mariniblastus sp.]